MIPAMSRSRSRKGPLVSLRRFARQTIAVTVLAGCLLVAAAFVAVAVQGNAVARDASAMQSEIAALEGELARKQALIAERQTDQYLVDKARDLGFVRPGEALVAVQRDGARAAEDAVAAAPGRLAKWWSVFFR